MKIISNNQKRELVSFFELPEKVQSDFDYVGDDDRYNYRFVNYKNAWYDVYDTQRISVDNNHPIGWAMVVQKDDPLSKWDSIVSESYFSGVLFRFVDDFDSVIVGRYFS